MSSSLSYILPFFLLFLSMLSSCSSSLPTFSSAVTHFISFLFITSFFPFFSLPSCPFHSRLPSSLPHLPTLLIKPCFPLFLHTFATKSFSLLFFLQPYLICLPPSFLIPSLTPFPSFFFTLLYHILFPTSFHLSLFVFSLCFSLNLSFLSYLSLLPTFLSFSNLSSMLILFPLS